MSNLKSSGFVWPTKPERLEKHSRNNFKSHVLFEQLISLSDWLNTTCNDAEAVSAEIIREFYQKSHQLRGWL